MQDALTPTEGFFHGTHRVVPPEVTWARIEPMLRTVGITRVADVTQLDRIGIPVFQAIRPMSQNLSVHQGKGASPMAARVSAVMEAIELWHAETLTGVRSAHLSLREMDYDNAISSDRLRWLPDAARLTAAPLNWVQVSEVYGKATAWLPEQMLRLDFTLDASLEPPLFHKTSNGLASGNTQEEALVHALCELIERHALYLKSEDPSRSRAVDPETVTDKVCRTLIGRMVNAGMKLAIFDITWDLGVPAFMVELVADDLPVICFGSGCHVSRGIALSRALTEAAQSRLTYIAGSRDDIIAPDGRGEGGRLYRNYDPPTGSCHFNCAPDLCAGTIHDSLRLILDRLSKHGYSAFNVDLTRPDLEIPVVFAFIPGLRDDPHD